MLRLQQILLYRELDIPLKEIKRIMSGADFEVLSALEGHKNGLRKRVAQMERLIQTVDDTLAHLKGEKTLSQRQFFEPFSDEQQAEYEKYQTDWHGAGSTNISLRGIFFGGRGGPGGFPGPDDGGFDPNDDVPF